MSRSARSGGEALFLNGISGLRVPLSGAPPQGARPLRQITDEAMLGVPAGWDLRVEPLVAEGDLVAQGAPVLRLRHAPAITLGAPMPAQVAEITLGPGHSLRGIRFFHRPEVGRHSFDTAEADSPEGLRRLMQAAGLWPLLRRRPFGGMPPADEVPGAVVVMAHDTQPAAPDPRLALSGRAEDLRSGLEALVTLSAGPVIFVQDAGREILMPAVPGVTLARCTAGAPMGQAGFQIHRLCPARHDRPVWDLPAEEVARLGGLLRCGLIDETRLITLAGPRLTQGLIRAVQPGADLRALVLDHLRPGPHRLVTGAPLIPQESPWLGLRDRQAAALERPRARAAGHWLRRALTQVQRPEALIPSPALERAMGRALPVMAFLRALAAGDADSVQRLGGLSLLPEDLALVDYVTGARPRPSAQLAALWARLAAEEGL